MSTVLFGAYVGVGLGGRGGTVTLSQEGEQLLTRQGGG